MDKVWKKNGEWKDSNSQLKHCINDMKPSMCALKETLISHMAELVENQKHNLILWLDELQDNLNFQPWRVSTIKVKHWL